MTPGHKTRRTCILVVITFDLYWLVCTIMLLLPYPPIPLTQQPPREVSLAAIKHFSWFLQLSEAAECSALSLIVHFCTSLVRVSHHCMAGYHYVTQAPIDTKNGCVCCHSVGIVKQTYLFPQKLFFP